MPLSAKNSMNLSQSLQNKIDPIVKAWIEAACQDDGIKPTQKLTFDGIRNSIPNLLEALVTLLSSAADDIELLVDKSLEHGVLRARQGYDPEEVAREYRILRQVIFSHLETDLLAGSPQEILEAVRLIDTAIDGAIATCFKSYTKERLEELETLHEQLELTNQELTRLVDTHQENFSKLAHELKNPLTSIIGYSDLFLRQQRQQEPVKNGSANLEHIERVLWNGRQLLHLINDALEISRYKAGKMQLNPNSVNVCAVISNVIEVLQPLAERKGLQLSITCTLDSKTVVTDALRLQQVLINLISNAIRYTESGDVKVVCQMANKQLAITVSDTGVGIAPKDQTKIFDPFYRVQNGHYAPDSTGLGLTIVSQLVELLQGEIQLVSHVGKGSAFTVILPLRLKAERTSLNGSNA